MAKVRLFVWLAVVSIAAVTLLHGARLPAGDDPALAVMAVVRVVAGVLAAYLLVATLIAVRLPRLAPGFVRRLVAAAVGGGLLLTPVAASAERAAPPVTEAPVLHRLPDPPTTRSGDATAPDVVPTRRQNEDAVAGEEIIVLPGDHLWGIAERALAARVGRAPSEAEIVPFWTALIEANRDRLLHRDDPDLIVPDQVLRLPS
jgi:nucleoid-associated protein YgaU